MIAGEPGLLSLVSWQAWLLLTWAVVVTWRVTAIAWQRYALHRLMRLTTAAGNDLAERVRELAERIGLRRSPQVLLVDHPGVLFVCGLWRPKLMLPQSLPGTLSGDCPDFCGVPAQRGGKNGTVPLGDALDLVLLHELAHLRRGDLYWGWTIELARTIYFFHPLVYWVGYCLHLEARVSLRSGGDVRQRACRRRLRANAGSRRQPRIRADDFASSGDERAKQRRGIEAQDMIQASQTENAPTAPAHIEDAPGLPRGASRLQLHTRPLPHPFSHVPRRRLRRRRGTWGRSWIAW